MASESSARSGANRGKGRRIKTRTSNRFVATWFEFPRLRSGVTIPKYTYEVTAGWAGVYLAALLLR